MANFRTHIAVGTVVSGMLATMTMAATVVTPNQILILALVGAFGSVLPDVDLGSSRSSRIMFFGLGLFMSFCVLFSFSWRYSIVEMWIIWLSVFMLVRYVGHYVFHHFARHRGVFHSLLAGLFFAFMTAFVFHKMFLFNETMSWLGGIFMFVGYVVHLLLDELYSVDFDDHRVKRSFGTALKLYEARNIPASVVMGIATIGAFFLTPSFGTFIDVFGGHDVWAFLWDRFLPDDSWFGIKDAAAKLASLVQPLVADSPASSTAVTAQ